MAHRGSLKYDAQFGAITMSVALTITILKGTMIVQLGPVEWPARTCSLLRNIRSNCVTLPKKLILPVVP